MNEFFSNPGVWFVIALTGFLLCTFLPIWISDETLRRRINWWVLIPVSLIIMIYVYPMGVEVFKKWAVGA